MPNFNSSRPAERFEFTRTGGIDYYENLLVRIQETTSEGDTKKYSAAIASQSSSAFFSDLWAAISLGTLCRRSEAVTAITWGIHSKPAELHESPWIDLLVGQVAVQMAQQVVLDANYEKLDVGNVEREISLHRLGILETNSGTTRTLVEFDPQQPLALSLQDPKAQLGQANLITQRRLFGQLLLRFRKDLEVGNINRGIPHLDVGAVKALGTFFSELHDNSVEHGKIPEDGHSKRGGIRFIRLRKHISNSRNDMLRRAEGFPQLHRYVDAALTGSGSHSFIEASVSDFGLGVVDHFLASPYGKDFRAASRRDLLERLLIDRLSAKASDPGAGLGIQRALTAAKDMAGFVSLRTGEFWLARSFSDPSAPLSMEDVKDKSPPTVAGTHWQFLWPQPI